MGSCCDFRDAAGRQFTADKAARELRAYRKGRVGPTTRLLRDGIIAAGLNHGSLLDVGGGVGALTYELLNHGVHTPSSPTPRRPTSRRHGGSGSARPVGGHHDFHGDLLQLADALPSTDLVTLDRVVCCYPSYEPMLEEAARHAATALALSYPRDRWFVRAVVRLENARRARTSGFHAFVHPPAAMRGRPSRGWRSHAAQSSSSS